MPTIIVYSLVFFIGAYLLTIIVELLVKSSLKRFVLELGIIVGVVLLLHVTTDFPTPRRAFGGVSSLAAIGIMFVCTILGIVGHNFFYYKKVVWQSFLKPLWISPIVLLPLIGSVQATSDIEPIQLISFGILAYQNGFFWNVILERTQLQKLQEIAAQKKTPTNVEGVDDEQQEP